MYCMRTGGAPGNNSQLAALLAADPSLRDLLPPGALAALGSSSGEHCPQLPHACLTAPSLPKCCLAVAIAGRMAAGAS